MAAIKGAVWVVVCDFVTVIINLIGFGLIPVDVSISKVCVNFHVDSLLLESSNFHWSGIFSSVCFINVIFIIGDIYMAIGDFIGEVDF